MDNLDNRLQQITLNTNEPQNNDGDKWGMPLKDLYRLAMTFYKGKNTTQPIPFTENLIYFQTNPVKRFISAMKII